MNKLTIILILFFLTSCAAIYAQPLSLHKQLQGVADKYLQLHQKDEGTTALTLAVYSPILNNTEIVTSGYTDLSQLNKVTAQSLYQIGSITKSFISVILLQLEVENIEFSINDKIGKYLPQYEKWKDVTIKQLLNMTGGIPDYTEDDQFWLDFSRHPYQYFKPESIVNYVYNQPLLFKPGTGWHYSNTGYILAGMIIEKITGHSLKEEIDHRFLNFENSSNLTLRNTFYITHDYPDTIYQRMVHGYIHNQKHAKYFSLNTDTTNFTLTWAGAAGAIISTPTDVMQWVHALYASTKLLPDKQQKELTSCVSMQTGQPINENKVGTEKECFGLGIGKFISPEAIAYTYEGSTIGYRVLYLYVPSTQVIIVIAVNSAVAEDHLDDLLDDTYSLMTKSKNVNFPH